MSKNINSEAFKRGAVEHDRTGNCSDNAIVKSNWGKLETEKAYPGRFATKA